MCWGDVRLCQTTTGQEYPEFNERETKTRSGNDPRNVRAIAPKMFAVPNNEKCPVKAYKVYAEKRPAEMKIDDAPYYLAVNNVKFGSGKPWYKKLAVGVNKLNTLMKTMAQKAGLRPNFKNHSGRKTIMQLSGHQNIQRITSYSTVSQKQRPFKAKKDGVFLFAISFFLPEIFKFLLICKLGTNDVTRFVCED